MCIKITIALSKMYEGYRPNSIYDSKVVNLKKKKNKLVNLKKNHLGHRVMVLWLRSLVAIVECPGLVPKAHVVAYNHP